MAEFPRLRTGAVGQYPFESAVVHPVRVLRFVDGSEQRFRVRSPSRQWTIRLSALDESEIAALEAFYLAHQGSHIRFDFTDPWTGERISNCRIDDSEFRVQALAANSSRVTITIVEEKD